MPVIKLHDADGFRAWANIIINNHETWEVPEKNAQLDIFNDDDTAYLVVNIYPTPTTVNQYSFIPEQDDEKALVLLFDFLKTVDFSLEKLFYWLEHTPFEKTEMGNRIFTHGLIICHEYLINSQPTHY